MSRSFPRGSILLCAENAPGKQRLAFQIMKKLSISGNDAVCFTAKRDGCGCGVLKEFYPLGLHTLRRNADGQLACADPAEAERFAKLTADFLAPYQMLREMRRESDLATFIPPFEIYRGCDETGTPAGTVYIWSPEPALETFDQLCAEIHAHPDTAPEYNLVRVLYSIESLVKCICILHSAGLIHRDIKPSNFGFVKRGNELLTQSISLFDVDTICSVYSMKDGEIRGSEGYLEPEVRSGRKKPNNQTDIYAIGATLFYAIIVTEQTRRMQFHYDRSLYPELRSLVDASELLTASDATSHPHLRSLLTRILQKSLCPRANRYASCEELLEDVQQALYYIVPAELAERGNAGVQWVLTDLKKPAASEQAQEKSATLAMQQHLYEYPLYTDTPAEKQTLDLLLIGCGKYGQLFLDLALQIAQMPGKRLRVTVVSASAEDKASYLADRPELSKFFGIDGALQEDAERYGDIRFVVHTLSEEDAEANRRFLLSLTENGAASFDCAFTAAGRNTRNLFFAGTAGTLCQSSFVWEGKSQPPENNRALLPVFPDENLRDKPFFSELERMAFNVHLIWNKNLDIDFDAVRKEFKKPYNHNSCVSFVLAVKYKLHSIGMEVHADTPGDTAEAFLSYISGHRAQRDLLVYYEHRRWVTEKLCLGYTAITDLNECAGGTVKDEKRRRHICIVRSTPAHSLAQPEWMRNGFANKQQWDHPSEKALAALDPLDRMSVGLHCMYLRHAAGELNSNLLNGEIMAAITDQTGQDPACAAALQELRMCMQEIRLGNSGQCRRYEGLRQAFLSAVRDSAYISERSRKTVQELTDALSERFYPILASQQYRNYKQDDEVLTDSIPFILTYSDDICMVIPFSAGSMTQQFGNLAAPAVVNPAKIIYPAYCAARSELDAIRGSLPFLTDYIERKKLRARVELLIGYQPDTAKLDADAAAGEIRTVSGRRIAGVKFIPAASLPEYLTKLSAHLRRRQQHNPHFFIEQNNTPLSVSMTEAGFCTAFPAYRFDSAAMQFHALHGCAELRHIRVKPFLTAADLPAFRISAHADSSKPAFYADYQTLWERYMQDTDAWRDLCTLLRAHTAEHDLIAEFRQNSSRSAKDAVYTYLVPEACRKSIAAILGALTAESVISPYSRIQNETVNTCTVTICGLCSSKPAFDQLFSRLDLLMLPDSLRCETDSRMHTVRVYCNHLAVTALDCTALSDNGYALLDAFSQKHYLINLSFEKAAKHGSFTFAAPQIKELLTDGNKILEIYTYHKAKETGAFDDIRSSAEFDPEKSPAEILFSCIMTKGFTTLFVSCRTAAEITPEYCALLAEHAEKYGINAKAVVISETECSSVPDCVVQISGKENLAGLGRKLSELIAH